jgi:hypothetical protein
MRRVTLFRWGAGCLLAGVLMAALLGASARAQDGTGSVWDVLTDTHAQVQDLRLELKNQREQISGLNRQLKQTQETIARLKADLERERKQPKRLDTSGHVGRPADELSWLWGLLVVTFCMAAAALAVLTRAKPRPAPALTVVSAGVPDNFNDKLRSVESRWRALETGAAAGREKNRRRG